VRNNAVGQAKARNLQYSLFWLEMPGSADSPYRPALEAQENTATVFMQAGTFCAI
jgi:hypothetical protein